MKTFRVLPGGQIGGTMEIPPSKSHTLRAILFSLFAKGTSKIHRYLDSTDAHAMIQAIERFGAVTCVESQTLTIHSSGLPLKPAEDVIDAGNSGLILRFVGAVAALSPHYTIITGDESIRHRRPASPLLDGLRQLGAFAESSRGDGYAPIIIKGPLKEYRASIDGRDSQPVSALLIASALAQGSREIHVKNPGETPWIDLTLHWLKQLGIRYEQQRYERFTIHGTSDIKPLRCTIPGDWSSALFPLAAALITQSKLTLTQLDFQDVQGDRLTIPLLQKLGANIHIDEMKKSITIHQQAKLKGGELDVNPIIDALPILCVIGLFGEDPLTLTNVSIAREKESDRVRAMKEELRKMDAQIEEGSDSIRIYPSSLKGANVFSHKDHRIAMALSIAALKAEGPTLIEDVACVTKTFPNFDRSMQTIGMNIKVL